MSCAEKLVLRKGGLLFGSFWDGENRSYHEKDLTSYAYRHLFDHCELEDEVTLRDLFLLMRTHLELFDKIFGYWCGEFVAEALTPIVGTNEQDIEFLELYFSAGYDSTDGKLFGLHLPSFHGQGYVLEKDDDDGFRKKGERIPYGLIMTPANEIAHLPLRLKTDCEITENAAGPKGQVLTTLQGMQFTLGQILLAPLWELSFFGSPSMREKKMREFEGDRNPLQSKGKSI